MQDPDKAPATAVKFALLAFVIASVGFAAYKMGSTPGSTPARPSTATLQLPVTPAPVITAKPKAKTPAAKSAIVYYFYTNTRCSSCKAIEAYTREAVERNFASDYNGWKVEFKGVNVEEEAGKHFVQDYWLNSKSVVVQKFSGEKALKYAKLEKVWQLLGDKDAFMGYITDETRKLLDEK